MVLGAINLAGQWTALWTKINQGDWATLSQLMTWVGIVLIVFAVGKFLWDKRRGGGGGMGCGSTSVVVAVVIGGLLSGPEVIIPVVLTIADLLVNLVVRILPGGAG